MESHLMEGARQLAGVAFCISAGTPWYAEGKKFTKQKWCGLINLEGS